MVWSLVHYLLLPPNYNHFKFHLHLYHNAPFTRSILELSRVILTLHFLLRCNGDPTKHEDWTAWRAYRTEEPQIGSFSVRIYSDFLSIFWPEAVIHSVSAWRTFKVCQPKWQILNNLKDFIPIHICKMHPHHSALVKVS